MGEINPINVYSSQLPADTLFQSNALSVSNKTFDSTNTVSSVSSLPSTVVNTTQSNVVTDAMLVAATYTKITITNKAKLPSDICYLNDSQTITNHIIDASNDISGALGAAGVALLASANVFTNSQTIQKDAQDNLILYRPSNVVGASGRDAIRFDANNSIGVRTTGIGYLLFEISDNVAATYDSKFEVWCKTNGVAIEYLDIDGATGGNLYCGGANRRIGIDDTGQTAQHVFTFPNQDTLLAGQNFANSFFGIQTFNNTVVQGNNTGYQIKTSGGTNITVLYMSAGNLFSIGDVGLQAINTSIWAGQSVAAISIDTQNKCTFTKMGQAGLAEGVAKWTVSDDTGSSIQFQNATAVDGQFVPWITTSTSSSVPSTHPSLYYYAYIQVAADTGSTPCIIIDSRRAGDTALTNRPVIDFRSAGVVFLKINANGDVSQVIKAQSGVWETLHTWTVNDNGNSFFRIVNQSGTNAIFVPTLQGVTDSTVTNAMGALYIQATIHSSLDTGSVPVMILRSNINVSDAVVAVRPLLRIENYTTNVWQMAAKGDIVHNVIAVTTTAEVIYEFSISDVASYIRIQNNTNANAQFLPTLKGRQVESAALEALHLEGRCEAGHDTGASPLMSFDVFRQDSVLIATRPLYEFRNFGTSVIRVNAKGNVTHNVLADVGGFDTLYTWTLSDDTNSTLAILNAQSVDGQFAPFINATISSNVSTSMPALWVRGNTPVASDSGTVPLMVFESRLVGQDVAVRPLFDFRNRNTSVLKIGATGSMTITQMAVPSVAEIPFIMSVSDDPSTTVSIRNGFPTDAVFAPIFLWQLSANNDSGKAACYFYTYINAASDAASSVPACVFNSGNSNATAIVNRPTHAFRNNGVTFFTFNAKGDVDHSIVSQAGVAEIIYDWLISDALNSYLRLQNYSSTDAVFVPNFRAINSQAANSFPAFVFHAYIATAFDSGTESAMIFDSRKLDESAISVRPLFKFRTAAIDVLLIYQSFIDCKALVIKNTKGLMTMADNGITGSVHCAAPVVAGVMYGTGILAYQVVTGASSAPDIDSSGGYNRTTAASGTDALAEIKTNQKVATRGKNSVWKLYAFIDNISDVRWKCGYNTSSGAVAGSVTISTGHHGAMFRFIAGTDTTFKFLTADGTNPESTPVDTGVTVAAATGYQFEIDANPTNITWTIYNASGAVLATGTVSTNIPATNQSMYLLKRTENMTATAKSWYFRNETIYRDA